MKLCKLLIIFFFIAHCAVAQVDAGLVNLGVSTGSNILDKMKQKKQAKAIENSLTTVNIGRVQVSMLRVNVDKITSRAKPYIITVQNSLDRYYARYKRGEHIDGSYEPDDIAVIRNVDPDWPADRYSIEWKAYRAYDMALTQHEQKLRDSLAAENRAADRKRSEEQAAAAKRRTDSIEYVQRVFGYHFINKEYVSLKEKPLSTSQSKGRLYKGSYIRVLGYSENSGFVKITLDGVEGFISRADLAENIDDIPASENERAVFKSRVYYKYEPNYDYVEPVQQDYKSAFTTGEPVYSQAPKARQWTSARSGSQSRVYITGPRGGCYYINSNGNKTYVDHSYCQ